MEIRRYYNRLISTMEFPIRVRWHLYIESGLWWPLLGRLKLVQVTATNLTWWRHQMETFSALLALCAGNSPVPGEFPAQRPVTRSFDVFFDLRLNKRLSKQPWGWWFETTPCSLWRHCNEDRIPLCPWTPVDDAISRASRPACGPFG